MGWLGAGVGLIGIEESIRVGKRGARSEPGLPFGRGWVLLVGEEGLQFLLL